MPVWGKDFGGSTGCGNPKPINRRGTFQKAINTKKNAARPLVKREKHMSSVIMVCNPMPQPSRSAGLAPQSFKRSPPEHSTQYRSMPSENVGNQDTRAASSLIVWKANKTPFFHGTIKMSFGAAWYCQQFFRTRNAKAAMSFSMASNPP